MKSTKLKAPLFCINEKCEHHKNQTGRWFVFKGYYQTKHNHKYIQRYQCKVCRTKFSENTFRDTYRQHKPHINKHIFNWYCSGATLRRMAKNLKITRGTAIRKFRFLANKSRMIHACELITGKLDTGEVHFDEQETFMHTKQMPLSIALAVDGKHNALGGKIIDIDVAMMPARGRNAKLSQARFGFLPDERPYVCQTVLNNVGIATGGRIILQTDSKPAYRTYVKSVLPMAIHRMIGKAERERQPSRHEDKRVPLWWGDQACASIRHDLSRMRRRTCVTTKDIHSLRQHLWLYTAHRNRYQRDLFDPWFMNTKFRNLKASYLAAPSLRIAE